MENIILNFLVTHISEQTTLTDWLSVFIYFFTLVAAITAAIIARKALDENRKTTKAQIEPFIDIKLETMPQSIKMFRLVVSNVGKESAFDVNVTLVPHDSLNQKEFIDALKAVETFKRIKFMRDGLNYLAVSDFRYTHYLNFSSFNYREVISIKEFLVLRFIATITYKDRRDKKYIRQFELDASEFDGNYSLTGEFKDKVPKYLSKISEELSDLNRMIKQEKYERSNKANKISTIHEVRKKNK